MKNYINPEIAVVELKINDILTTSPGTETPPYEVTDGSWEMGVSL